MITSIRKYMKSRAFRVIIWLGVFSLVGGMSLISSLSYFFKKKELMGVASVDGNEISLMEFQRNYLPIVQFIKDAKKKYGAQASLILSIWGLDANKKTDEFVLEKLVQEKATQNEADKLHARVSEDYVNNKLHDTNFVRNYLGNLVPPQAIQNGQIDGAILNGYLERLGMSEADFYNNVNQILKRELLFNIIDGSEYVSLSDLKEEYIRSYPKRKFAIASFDIKTFLDAVRANKLKDEEISKYFNENKNNYMVPEKRSGNLWTFDSDGYGVVVSDKDIELYYAKHKSDYILTPGQRKVKHILIEINSDTNEVLANKKAQEILEQINLNPDSFDKFAKEDSMSPDKDKEISVKRGDSDPVFEQAVFSISAPGQISSVVKTQKGFEIIKLMDIIKAEYKALDDVKEEIAKKIKSEKFEKEFNADAKRVISQASDIPSVFEKYTQNRKAKISEIGPEEKSYKQESIKLFSFNNIGDRAYYFTDNTGYIIELSGIEKSYMPKLDDVKSKVSDDLYLEKAKKELKDTLSKLEKTDSKSFEKAVKKANGSIENTGLIDPQDSKSFTVLNEKNIPTADVFKLTKIGTKFTDIGQDHGYIVELIEIDKFDESEFEKNKQEIDLRLHRTKTQEKTQAYIKWLEKNAKIEINKPLLKRIVGLA